MPSNIQFCPRCHKRIKPPMDLRKVNLQGALSLSCPCGGTKKVPPAPASATPTNETSNTTLSPVASGLVGHTESL